jgi:Right handed beta helix region
MLALGWCLALLGFWAVACGSSGGPPPPIQLTGRPLGSSFVAVTGTGFPAGTAAVVTGTTPQGATTVNVTTDQFGELTTSVVVPNGYQGPLDVKATVGGAAASATVDAGRAPHEQPGDDAGARPLNGVACTTTADVGSVPSASPGDVVCLTGDLSNRLEITAGGTPGKPVTYSGGGNTTVQGIDVTTDNVIVEGFESKDAKNMGARLQGNNITFRDNTIKHPVYDGDDTDGLRFFGDDITILHNTVKDVSDGSDCGDNGCGDGPHPDCMQTFYSQRYPTSSDVMIEGNRCDDIAAQCVIAEGPVLPDEGVNGPGESADWTVYDNYCNTGAAQAMQYKDVKNVTIADNFFDGSNNKAISLSNASTGAHVGGNKLGPNTAKLITFDDGDESAGYIGPTPDQ